MPRWNEISTEYIKIEILKLLYDGEAIEQRKLKVEIDKRLNVSYELDEEHNWKAKISATCIDMKNRRGWIEPKRKRSPQVWEITEKGRSYLLRLEPGYSTFNTKEVEPNPESIDNFEPENLEQAREYIQRTILARRGQRKFREMLIREYGSCVLTGCNSKEVLEAAHIKAYATGGRNILANGLLLRADIHTLFDLGLVSIDPDTFRVRISESLKQSMYEELEGRLIHLSKTQSERLDKEALEFHYRNIYKSEWMSDEL
jgi:hypothetical protein